MFLISTYQHSIEIGEPALEFRFEQIVHMASHYPKSQEQQAHHCAFQTDQQHAAISFVFPTWLHNKQTKQGISWVIMGPKTMDFVHCSRTIRRVKIHRLSSLAKVRGRRLCEQLQLLDQHLHGHPQQHEKSHLLSWGPTLEKFCLMSTVSYDHLKMLNFCANDEYLH